MQTAHKYVLTTFSFSNKCPWKSTFIRPSLHCHYKTGSSRYSITADPIYKA